MKNLIIGFITGSLLSTISFFAGFKISNKNDEELKNYYIKEIGHQEKQKIKFQKELQTTKTQLNIAVQLLKNKK